MAAGATAPGGDAMTVRFHHDAEAAALKRAVVPRPVAWRMRAADVARFAAQGQHCQARRCRSVVVVCTWRWWRSSEVGKVLLAEHFTCDQHGQEFAGRHHIEIEPEPPPAVSAAPGGER
jgi:hypothetical protein